MKVGEYLPVYGLIMNCEHTIAFNDVIVPARDLFTNFPDLELTPDQVCNLDAIDCTSLQNVLSQLYVSDEIITACLKNLLENYIKKGGNTEHWVRQTFHSVPTYSTKLRTIIELYLLSISHLVSYAQPVHYQVPTTSNTSTAITSTVQPTQPVYDNLRDAFNSAAEYNLVMAILHENGSCTVNGTWRDYSSGWKSLLTKIIKWLALHGFCKNSTFTTSEIQAICLNTFKTEKISFSTIEHHRPDRDQFSALFKELKK